MKEIVSKEVALDEFNRLVQQMDLETDHSDPDLKAAFMKNKSTVVKGIMAGKISLSSDASEITVGELVFREPTGAVLSNMNKVMNQKNNEIAGLYAAMAEMSRTSPQEFATMPLKQLKYAKAVGSLLLGE